MGSTSEEEYEIDFEENQQCVKRQRSVSVCLAITLLISVAMVARPVAHLFAKMQPSESIAKNQVIGQSWVEGQMITSAPPAAATSSIPATPSSPSEILMQNATSAGSCSELDQATISQMPVGSGSGSMGLATYECFKKSWSFIGLIDSKGFSQCLHEKTKISTSCGSCYAGYSKFGVTHCAMQCMVSWCSTRCLKCNSQYKSSLDTCTGFTSASPIPCDAEYSTVHARKLSVGSNPISV